MVDDEPLVRSAVRRALRGHDVRLEESAHAALRLISRGERFDRILCDVMMPGMDGFAFAEALAGLEPAQAERVVFMTGGAVGERAARLLREQPERARDARPRAAPRGGGVVAALALSEVGRDRTAHAATAHLFSAPDHGRDGPPRAPPWRGGVETLARA